MHDVRELYEVQSESTENFDIDFCFSLSFFIFKGKFAKKQSV